MQNKKCKPLGLASVRLLPHSKPGCARTQALIKKVDFLRPIAQPRNRPMA